MHPHWFTIIVLVAWLIYARLEAPSQWVALGLGVGFFGVVPAAEFRSDDSAVDGVTHSLRVMDCRQRALPLRQ
jgi:hypothetical protein